MRTAIGAEPLNDHSTVPSNPARLGANHGYLIHGDVAHLHADVEGLHAAHAAVSWALQLWACDMPHTGGPVSGIKIAETQLTGTERTNAPSLRLDAAADAAVPGGQRDYAMVLVLASGTSGRYQIHDFANYPDRQRFVTPHLEGRVGYRIDGSHVVLEVEAIRSPRSADNISGSLSLELRAVAQPYFGGSGDGQVLGQIDLGRLAGQDVLGPIEARVPFTAPADGEWEVVMTLREWTEAAGYVTRDHVRFAIPYRAAVSTEAETPTDNTIAAIVDLTDVPVVPEVPVVQAVPATSTARDVAASHVRTPSRPKASAGVSINGATVEQIAAVKGISPKLAKEIVRGRPYASLSALLDVRGIGPKLLEKLRPYLSI